MKKQKKRRKSPYLEGDASKIKDSSFDYLERSEACPSCGSIFWAKAYTNSKGEFAYCDYCKDEVKH
jgi:hypothetical protein